MEESKMIGLSVKPLEQQLIETLKEAGRFYTTSDLMRAALWALAEKILNPSALASAKKSAK